MSVRDDAPSRTKTGETMRYHFSTWGNGPNEGQLVEDSLEPCVNRRCTYDHVVVIEESEYNALKRDAVFQSQRLLR